MITLLGLATERFYIKNDEKLNESLECVKAFLSSMSSFEPIKSHGKMPIIFFSPPCRSFCH